MNREHGILVSAWVFFFFLSAIITDCEFLPYCWEEKKFTVQQNILFRIRFPLLSVWDFNCLKQWTDVTVLLWSVKNAAWLVGVKIVICLGTFSTQVSLTCPTSRFLFKLTSLFPSVFSSSFIFFTNRIKKYMSKSFNWCAAVWWMGTEIKTLWLAWQSS